MTIRAVPRSADALYHELVEHGADLVGPPQVKSYRMKELDVRDLDTTSFALVKTFKQIATSQSDYERSVSGTIVLTSIALVSPLNGAYNRQTFLQAANVFAGGKRFTASDASIAIDRQELNHATSRLVSRRHAGGALRWLHALDRLNGFHPEHVVGSG